MKYLILTIIILFSTKVGFNQNLVSNWSFENGQMQRKCEGWFDICGNEITYLCDSTSHLYCGVKFYNESPSTLPEEQWSIGIQSEFPASAFAETYITGQQGKKIYQLKFWMKSPDWSGIVFLGTIKNGQFIVSKSIQEKTPTWKDYEIIDTIRTMLADTIAVRLSIDRVDLMVPYSHFDLIELNVLGVIDSFNELENNKSQLQVIPNPSSEEILVCLDEKQLDFDVKIFDMYGKLMKTCILKLDDSKINIGALPPGIYILTVQNRTNKQFLGVERFAKQ